MTIDIDTQRPGSGRCSRYQAGERGNSMNNSRRKRLAEIQERLQDIMSALDEIRNEEQEAYDNLPESIQYSERGDVMTDAIDNIDEAVSTLEDVDTYIDDAKGGD